MNYYYGANYYTANHYGSNYYGPQGDAPIVTPPFLTEVLTRKTSDGLTYVLAEVNIDDGE